MDVGTDTRHQEPDVGRYTLVLVAARLDECLLNEGPRNPSVRQAITPARYDEKTLAAYPIVMSPQEREDIITSTKQCLSRLDVVQI